jgi:fibronectin type 3 domain-containing protein
MTHKISNVINIKIDTHKKKKSKSKKRTTKKHTHVNAPYSNIAISSTNKSQQLDTSTATQRERESIIGTAIENNQLKKNILLLEDGFKDHIPKSAMIKFTEPKKLPIPHHTPRKVPVRIPITDQNFNYDDNFFYTDVIPPRSNPMFEELHAKQRDDEETRDFEIRHAKNEKQNLRNKEKRADSKIPKPTMETRSQRDIFREANNNDHSLFHRSPFVVRSLDNKNIFSSPDIVNSNVENDIHEPAILKKGRGRPKEKH